MEAITEEDVVLFFFELEINDLDEDGLGVGGLFSEGINGSIRKVC